MRRHLRIKSTFSKVSLIKSRPLRGVSLLLLSNKSKIDKASHIMLHWVPSVCSLDNYCCKRIPPRVNALPSYPYDQGRMLGACPLKSRWSSLTYRLSRDEKQCSSSTMSPWLSRNSSKNESQTWDPNPIL